MIIKIGDQKRQDRDEHLRKLKSLIIQEKVDNFMMVAQIFTKCVLVMPHKTHLYSALLGLIALDDFELAQEFWKFFCGSVKEEGSLMHD